jgi:hypothetical protein
MGRHAVAVLAGVAVLALMAEEVQALDATGTKFWAADVENTNSGGTPFGLGVVNIDDASATVEVWWWDPIPNKPVLKATATVAAGAGHTFSMTEPSMWGSGVSRDGVYVINSTKTLRAMQMNPLASVESNDATQLIAQENLGTAHRVMTFPPHALQSDFVVVATEDDTKVSIVVTTAVIPIPGHPPLIIGVPADFILNEYQALRVRSAAGGDLTGSTVQSSKPVAVFSGDVCTKIGSGACDVLVEQTWPVSAWRSDYQICRAPQRSTEPITVRVLALEDATITTKPLQAGTPATLPAGHWMDITTQDDFFIHSDGRISVGEFLHGDPTSAHVGDPSFTQVPPILDHYYNVTFQVPPNFNDYLVVSADYGFNATIYLDGFPITSTQDLIDPQTPQNLDHPVGARCFRIPITDGVHTVNSTGPFHLRLYGYDTYGSYAYPVVGNNPDPQPVTWAAGEDVGGELLVTGNDSGCGLGDANSTLIRRADLAQYIPLAGDSKRPPPGPLASPRFHHAAFTIKESETNHHFVLAGAEDCAFTPRSDAEAMAYDPLLGTRTWTTAAALNQARIGPAYTSNNSAWPAYVAGGDMIGGDPDSTASWHEPTSSLEVRSSMAGSWLQGPSMPAGVVGAAAAVSEGRLVVVGGASHPQTENRVIQEYDPATNTWLGNHLPVELSAHRALECGGTEFVVGGMLGDTDMYSYEVFVTFNGVTDLSRSVLEGVGSWTNHAVLPTGVAYHGGAVWNDNKLVITGGIRYTGAPMLGWGIAQPTSHVIAVDCLTGALTLLDALPVNLAEHAMAIIGNDAYVFGGNNWRHNSAWTGRWEGNCPTSQVYKHSLTSSGSGWTLVGSMPVATAAMGSALLPNGTVFLAGGRVAGLDDAGMSTCLVPSARTFIFDPVTSQFFDGPDLPEPLIAPSLHAVGYTVFVVGGDETGDVPVPVFTWQDRQRRPSTTAYKTHLPLPGPSALSWRESAKPLWLAIDEAPLGVVWGDYTRSDSALHLIGGHHHPNASVRIVQDQPIQGLCVAVGLLLPCAINPAIDGAMYALVDEWLWAAPTAVVHHGFEANATHWVIHGGLNGSLYQSRPGVTSLLSDQWILDVASGDWRRVDVAPRAFAVGSALSYFATGTVEDHHRTMDTY